jgi:hypothetical protein
MLTATAAMPVRASTQISPGFPTPDYAGGHFWTQSYSYQVRAQAGLVNPVINSDQDNQQLHPDALPGFLAVPVATADAHLALGPPYNATEQALASVAGAIAPGVAKAYAHASAFAGDCNSSATVVLEILEVLDIDKGGLPDFDLNYSGSVGTNDNNGVGGYATSTMRTEIFVWPFGAGIPAVGHAFDAAYFKSLTLSSATSKSIYEDRDPSFSFTDGSRWWLCARAEVDAVAGINREPIVGNPDYQNQDASADFANSIYLRIHPDPSTPDFSFTASSGFDYTSPIPEPATVLLMVMGMALSRLGPACPTRGGETGTPSRYFGILRA